MIKIVSFALAALLLLSASAQAQTVGVLLNSAQTSVVGTDPTATPGTGGLVYASISTSDSRWTAWQAIWGPNGSIALGQQYSAAYTALIAPGFALTSSSLGCSPCMMPVDQGTQANLQALFSLLGASIITATTSGATLSVASIEGPPLAVGQFVSGPGIPAGDTISSVSPSVTLTTAPSPSISPAEYMAVGSPGSGWPGGVNSVQLATLSGVVSFNLAQFVNYEVALKGLAACNEQAWLSNSQTFPTSCTSAMAATIP